MGIGPHSSFNLLLVASTVAKPVPLIVQKRDKTVQCSSNCSKRRYRLMNSNNVSPVFCVFKFPHRTFVSSYDVPSYDGQYEAGILSINSIEVRIHLNYKFNLRLSNFIINSTILNTYSRYSLFLILPLKTHQQQSVQVIILFRIAC